MVEITVILEGGIVNNDTVDVSTVDNSQALRQSINRIFSELLNKEVSIIIQMGAGYRNAALQFSKEKSKKIYLYVDLDDKKANIQAWFTRLETENPQKPIVIPQNKRDKVFFMIQEMEAWILKQPQSIEKWGGYNGYKRLHANIAIKDHSLISGKDIEDIKKPSKVLYNIIKHFFSKEYNGKNKKIQYTKMKSASGILDNIDTSQLLNLDSELQRFCKTIMIP